MLPCGLEWDTLDNSSCCNGSLTRWPKYIPYRHVSDRRSLYLGRIRLFFWQGRTPFCHYRQVPNRRHYHPFRHLRNLKLPIDHSRAPSDSHGNVNSCPYRHALIWSCHHIWSFIQYGMAILSLCQIPWPSKATLSHLCSWSRSQPASHSHCHNWLPSSSSYKWKAKSIFCCLWGCMYLQVFAGLVLEPDTWIARHVISVYREERKEFSMLWYWERFVFFTVL